MILINFSHPLTDQQRKRIELLTGQPIEEKRYPVELDNNLPFVQQIKTLLDSVSLTGDEWQNLPIIINPPAYNFAALTLLAELHGRMGFFPSIIRIKPVKGSTPVCYEVAELINLQDIRQTGRKTRFDENNQEV